ncbi:hypothetical protein [Streptomyces taklimakanensis]|nr:hypothetical protein [Streptomyces taklimakanensis]
MVVKRASKEAADLAVERIATAVTEPAVAAPENNGDPHGGGCA